MTAIYRLFPSSVSTFYSSLKAASLASILILSACSASVITTPVDESLNDTTLDSKTASDGSLTLIEFGDTWRYKKGTSAPSSTWNTTNYDDSSWTSGSAGFGYGNNTDTTVLADMAGNYLTLYLRKTFINDNNFNLNALALDIDFNDGFVAYLNGQEVARSTMPDGTPSFDTAATGFHQAGTSVVFDLSSFTNIIVSGTNVFSIEVHNRALDSSSLSFDTRLLLNTDPATINTGATDTSNGTGDGTGDGPGDGTGTGSGDGTGDGTSSTNGTSTGGLDGPGGLCAKGETCGSFANYVATTPGTAHTECFSQNLSGITYVADSNTFYMIENGGAKICEVDASYNFIRLISSSGFGDAEDLVYLGSNNEFAIVNESSKLYIGTIAPDATSINAADFQEITFDSYSGNTGAEGVAFDISTQTFYVVKEKSPRVLYSFPRPASSQDVTVTPSIPFDLQTTPSPRVGNDVSSVVFDSSTGRLLILSDIDYRVVDVDLNGVVYGVLQFPNYKQHEGITLDANHALHAVSEANTNSGRSNEYTIYSN